jgi:hypothetical protein
MEKHGGAIFYYIPMLMLMLLPHTALLIRIFPRIRFIRSNSLDMFMWLWFLFVFVFFSLSGTKLPHYILYGCTPLFILMARYRHLLKSRFIILIPAIIFALFTLFLPEIAREATKMVEDPDISEILINAEGVFSWQYRAWGVIALLVLIFMIFFRVLKSWQALVFAGLITIFLFTHLLYPILGDVMQKPVKEAALIARERNYDVVMWGIIQPSFSVYRQQVTQHRKPEDGDILFTSVSYLEKLADYQVLYKRGGVALVKVNRS